MKYTDEMIYEIIDSLPHDNGFTDRWNYEIDTKGKLHLYQTYNYMDENGLYDTYIVFEVVIYEDDFKIHFHRLTNHQKYIVYKNNLREYFEGVFAWWYMDYKNILEKY